MKLNIFIFVVSLGIGFLCGLNYRVSKLEVALPETGWSKWSDDWEKPGHSGLTGDPMMEQSRYNTNTGAVQYQIAK